jgi:hypothetical protein
MSENKITFIQILTVAVERSNQLQIYWGFYATAVLGILAFFGSSHAPPHPERLAWLITIAFLGLSAANLEALCDVTRQRLAVQPLLLSLAEGDESLLAIAKSVRPSSLFAVRAFHLLLDVVDGGEGVERDLGFDRCRRHSAHRSRSAVVTLLE